MRATFTAVAITAVLFSSLPASAQEVPPPEAVALQTYFHCAGDVRVQNALTAQDPPSWDATKPGESVQAGTAGCATADPARTGTNQENVYDGVFKGFFTGNLDSMTVRLHDMGVGAGRTGANQPLGIRVSVDGKSMFGTITPAPSPLDAVLPPGPVPATSTVSVKPAAANSGATNYLEFTVTGLGFMTEPGAGSVEREVLVTVNSLGDGSSMWVMDTSEVPSGITFNPAAPAAATLAATTPGEDPPVE